MIIVASPLPWMPLENGMLSYANKYKNNNDAILFFSLEYDGSAFQNSVPLLLWAFIHHFCEIVKREYLYHA